MSPTSTPYHKMSFLVQPSDNGEYDAISMERGEGGILRPTEERHIATASTAVAALTILTASIRGRQPRIDEVRPAIRRCMLRNGMTIRDLALKVDYSRANLSRILDGDLGVSLDELYNIAKAANIPDNMLKHEVRMVQHEMDKAAVAE